MVPIKAACAYIITKLDDPAKKLLIFAKVCEDGKMREHHRETKDEIARYLTDVGIIV